jgi:hypothetical protein
LRLDFEKGPIHPSPLGPSILTTVTGSMVSGVGAVTGTRSWKPAWAR